MKYWRPGIAILLTSIFPYNTAQNVTDKPTNLDQLAADLPPCALQCSLIEVSKSVCTSIDISCICTNQQFNNNFISCFQQKCKVVEQLQTRKLVNKTCGMPIRDIRSRIVVINWVFYGLALFAVFCRLIARIVYFGTSFACDDYVIIINFFTLTLISTIAQMMVKTGLGQDIWELSSHEISDTLFYFYIEEYLYNVMSALTKIAILQLYLRVFKIEPSFQIQCYVLIAIVGAYTIGGMVSNGLYCRPISYVWNGWDGEHVGTCMNINAQTYAMAGVNICLDIAIFILPTPLILKLHITRAKRFGVASIFAAGLFVTVCSVIRLTTLLKWAKSKNPTYDYSDVAIWSLIEIMIAVICACMPGMAGLARHIFPKSFSSNKGEPYLPAGWLDDVENAKSLKPKNILSRTIVSIS